MNLLTAQEREQMVKNLTSQWHITTDKISCRLNFQDFTSAFSFMAAIAIQCEKMNHHPTWINTYNSLDIELSTHDVGGLTALDFKLAGIIEYHYSRYKV